MILKSILASCALFGFLIPAAPAAGQDSGGGVAAPNTPASAVSSAEPATAEPDPAPPAEATQDDTPTTPGGEEQPGAEQPDGQQTPTEQPGSETPPSAEGGVGGTAGGGLPQTGLELFALTSIGLGLLLAGAALRPTSSWPPPRDRLSRSTPRR